MPRASRKKRLPIGTTGAPAPWALSDAAWSRCEAAYGISLPTDLRGEVERIVIACLEAEPFGRRAPFTDSALEWLTGVERAAHAFGASLTARGGGGASAYAEAVMNGRLPAARDMGAEDGERPLPRIAQLVREAAIAAALARAEIEDEDAPRFDERTAWRSFVIRLWRAAAARGLPVAINKSGVRRSKADGVSDAASPFVRFVAAVQEALPPEVRRHDHSHATLATSVAKAVRAAREINPADL